MNNLITIKTVLFAIVCLFYLMLPVSAENKEPQANHAETDLGDNRELIKIGVLSKRSVPITIERWSGLAKYLQQQIPTHRFVIVPLSFDSTESIVASKKVDFLLTNPSMFVNLSFKYSLFAIATLKRKILGHGYTDFGSVIFSKQDNNLINNFDSLAGTEVAAVSEHSFGGWVAALREFDDQGITIDSFHSLSFLGSHDAVVEAVLNKSFDVGIVRTDAIERMANEGVIELSSLKIIKPSDYKKEDFPFLRSSRLYPEWPMSSLNHVPVFLAEKVSAALLTMKSDSSAAQQAQIMGWTVPKNYREIDHALSQLNLGYYKDIKDYSFLDVVYKYWLYLLALIIVIFIAIVVLFYILSLNKKLKLSQTELRKQATHDSLTGLANRSLFYELARSSLFVAKREEKIAMILFLDLDKFKAVNDSYGHDVGDQLLIDVASRLTECLRGSDIVARIGGDEFLIMLNNVHSIKDFELVMQRMIETLGVPFVGLNGENLNIGCSIGASHFPKQGDNLQRLVKQADISLYQAKEAGRGTYIIYSD